MKLKDMKGIIDSIQGADDVEVMLRYTDISGITQTVPLKKVLEESQLGDPSSRAFILSA